MVARQSAPPPQPTPFSAHLTPVPAYQDPLTRLDEQARFVETALLASILLDPAIIHPISELVDDGDFLAPAHAQTYRCMVGLMRRKTPPDIVNVSYALTLQTVPLATAVDLSRMLVIAAENAVFPCFALSYAEQVAELSERRRLVRQAQEQVQRAVNPAPLAPPVFTPKQRPYVTDRPDN